MNWYFLHFFQSGDSFVGYPEDVTLLFRSTEQAFIVTLKNLNYEKTDVTENIPVNVTVKNYSKDRGLKIIELIKQNKNITKADLAFACNVSGGI